MIDFEKILEIKGKKKADLARFLQIQANNVNRIIRNEKITLSQIETICEFLEISVIDAFRLSGYNDKPAELDALDQLKRNKEVIDQVSEVFYQELLRLFRDKIVAPYAIVEEKERKIEELNRTIGRLEEQIKSSNAN